MYDKFRVICCENPNKYPGKLFIDIYPADHITHELLYQMRLKLTPDVYDITGGVYLDDLGGGNVRLQYIKHYDKRIQKQQALIRERVDAQIIKLFKDMKDRGVDKTISASLTEVYEVFRADEVYPKSAKDEKILNAQRQYAKRQKIMAQRQQFYAQQKHASAPHIALMINQLERSGD